jgi:Na+/H+ antiporter
VELALVVTGIVLVVLAGSALAGRLDVPAPLLLTVVGAVVAFVPVVPDVRLGPEVVLVGLLPPLLYAAAIRTSLIDFRANTRPIVLLSVVLVIVSTLAVGAVAHWLLPISWPAALALGAVVAPPDAVAATAIARRVGMPRRVVTILEGESLVNDATALVSLRTATAAIVALSVVPGAGDDHGGGAGEAVTRLDAAGVGRIAVDFLWAAGGGLAVGVLVAVVLVQVRRRLTDTISDTTLSLIAPWVAFLPAEELHCSGVLAVVVTGLLLGHKAPLVQSAASRISERTYWRTIQHLLENGVFLLVGLQTHRVVTDVAGSDLDLGTVLVACGGVLLAVVLVRPLWVFPSLYLPRMLSARRRATPLPWQVPAVISWSGMRGVVTLAAVFTLPPETEHREVLVLAALVVTFGTLLLQGTSLPWVVRRLGLTGPDPLEDRLQEAAVLEQAAAAGLRHLDAQVPPDHPDPDGVLDALRQQSRRRTFAVWERLGGQGTESPVQKQQRLRLGMLAAERAEVLRLRDEAEVPHEVLQSVMAALDVEESVLVRATEAMDALPERDTELVAPRRAGGTCDHLAAAPAAVRPIGPGVCTACVELGWSWVHLRMCLGCGNVACCDSSRGTHASVHAGESGHPVMRSVEPGEAWRWCYVDEQLG